MHSTPQPAPPAALERLGRYRIVRPLSKGGMALVYEARRESLAGVSPRVAIKLILPEYTDSDTFQELFINEARLGASMHHQNLVQIQDFDQDGDRFFLVMEYVEGITLRRAISLCRRNEVHVPVGVVAEVGRQACDGLAYAHGARDEDGEHLGLIHRDVKPSNLILNPQGVVKLVDFGISKGFRLVEKRGTVKGTWGYMAYEQAMGQEVGPGTDVFGLATVLFEMASKQPMFPDKTPEVVKRLLAKDHPIKRLDELDGSYRVLIDPLTRALQRNPRDRYADASEFGRALSASLPDPISARDEVVRYYEGVDALHRGLPVPEGTLATGSSSPADASAISIGGSVARPAESEDDGSMVWIIGAVAGLGVVGTVALMAGLLYLMPPGVDADARDPSLGDVVDEVVPAPQPAPRAVDEPAGPAGEGAPGEAVPPPVAERTAPPERRPPPSTIPVTASDVVPRIRPTTTASPTSVEPEPVDADVQTQAEPEPERVVVVTRAPEPPPEPVEAAPEPTQPTETPAPEATGPAFLTIGARQPAEVYIDGRYIRKVPLMNRELPSGVHVITIQALDGRKKVFEVDLEPGEEMRRVWDFERSEWRP